MMKLLKDLEINSFTALNFVSDKAREVWEPVINNCKNLVQELELLSVAEDQRPCAWRTVKTSEVWRLTRECLELGLNTYPIENIGSWGDGFTHKTEPAIEGKPMSTYCVITKKIEHAKQYYQAFKNGDHKQQGKLLGFPQCCTEFFDKNWPEYFDPIWQASLNSCTLAILDGINLYQPHAMSNPILRYIGLRIGFHIPCSFNCRETVNIATDRIELCKTEKQKDTMKLLISLLSMPIEWSVLHGIALIKTPIFQFRANSMPTGKKIYNQVKRRFYPPRITVWG